MRCLYGWLAAAIAIAGLATGSNSGSAWAEIDGDDFSSRKWRIRRISAPANWRLSEQKSYAATCVKAVVSAESGNGSCKRSDERYSQTSILLWMHRRSPTGKMLLAGERLHSQTNSLEYAEKTRELLGKLGFEVRAPQLHAATGAYWLEFDDGKTFLRQAVLVSGGIGYSLTLAAPDARTRAKHLRAFDYALRSIRINRKKSTQDDDSTDSTESKEDAAADGEPSSGRPSGKPPDKPAGKPSVNPSDRSSNRPGSDSKANQKRKGTQ